MPADLEAFFYFWSCSFREDVRSHLFYNYGIVESVCLCAYILFFFMSSCVHFLALDSNTDDLKQNIFFFFEVFTPLLGTRSRGGLD